MRLDKFLGQLKYGSRNEIKKMVNQGLIFINDTLCEKSDSKINPEYDKITINGKVVFYKETVTLALYKPIGYLSANHDTMHKVLFELLKDPYNRFDFSIAGRLDLDSEGLIILSTDGALIHQITHPKKHLNKVYEVLLDGKPKEEELSMLKNGVSIKDQHDAYYQATALSLTCQDETCLITIDEGKFHQVKRMFKHIGFTVLNLKRISIGSLSLKALKPGEYSEINPEDIFL